MKYLSKILIFIISLSTLLQFCYAQKAENITQLLETVEKANDSEILNTHVQMHDLTIMPKTQVANELAALVIKWGKEFEDYNYRSNVDKLFYLAQGTGGEAVSTLLSGLDLDNYNLENKRELSKYYYVLNKLSLLATDRKTINDILEVSANYNFDDWELVDAIITACTRIYNNNEESKLDIEKMANIERPLSNVLKSLLSVKSINYEMSDVLFLKKELRDPNSIYKQSILGFFSFNVGSELELELFASDFVDIINSSDEKGRGIALRCVGKCSSNVALQITSDYFFNQETTGTISDGLRILYYAVQKENVIFLSNALNLISQYIQIGLESENRENNRSAKQVLELLRKHHPVD